MQTCFLAELQDIHRHLGKPSSNERVNIKREQLNPSTCPTEISSAPWWQFTDMKKKGNINMYKLQLC